MKKRNLLTLGALVLSLGLTVSSCAGTQGEQGPVGPQGPQGEQGEPGQKGEDGKSYVPVIVVNDNDIQGGTVTQDKYWVEAGKEETVTFTFTPAQGNDIILKFEINGVEVSVTPDQTTLEYTVPAEMYAVQVTAATFTNAKDYGESLITTFWGELTDSDNQILLGEQGEVAGDYADQTLKPMYEGLVNETTGAVAEALGELEEGATASEKLDTATSAANTAIEKIQAAYDLLVADAKLEAKEALQVASDAVSHTGFAATDREALLTSGNAAIDACTTLEAITALVNTTPAGSLNKLYSEKTTQFAALDAAFVAAVTEETALEDPTSDDYKSLVATLENTYGISVDSLPVDVRNEAYAAVSAATTVDAVKSAGEAGVDAIEATIGSLKDQLVEAIRNQYVTEINESEVLSTLTDTRSRLIAAVQTEISNYVANDTETSPKSISKYVSVEGTADFGTTGWYGNGLIYNIETRLEQTDIHVEAFKQERITNALDDAKVAFQAAIDTIEDADYFEAIAGTLNTSGDLAGKYSGVTAQIGNGNAKVANPFYTGDATTGWTPVTGTNVGGLTGVTTYNVNTHLTNLSSETFDSPLEIKDWQADHVGDFGKIHDAAVTVYENAQKAASLPAVKGNTPAVGEYDPDHGNKLIVSVEGGTLTHTTYVDYQTIEGKWNALIDNVTTMDRVSEIAEATVESTDLLIELDSAVSTFVANVVVTDPDYRAHFDTVDGLSTFRDSFDDQIEGVLDGSISSVASYITEGNLTSLYEADVAATLADLQDIFTQAYQNKIVGSTTSAEYAALRKVYQTFTSLVGHRATVNASGELVVDNVDGEFDFRCETLTSVNAWFEKATNALDPKETTEVLPDDISTANTGLNQATDTWGDGSAANTAENSVNLKISYNELTDTVVLTGDISDNILGDGTTAGSTGGSIFNSNDWGKPYFTFLVKEEGGECTTVRSAYVSSPTDPMPLEAANGAESINKYKDNQYSQGGCLYLVGLLERLEATPYIKVQTLRADGSVINEYTLDLTGLFAASL